LSAIWGFIGGSFFGATMGVIIMCIFTYGKGLPDEEYPPKGRATDNVEFTPEQLAELRAIK